MRTWLDDDEMGEEFDPDSLVVSDDLTSARLTVSSEFSMPHGSFEKGDVVSFDPRTPPDRWKFEKVN